MFVVIINDFSHINGGAAKVAITSARGLADRGFQVLFISATEGCDALLAHDNITLECLGLNDVWSIRNPIDAAAKGLWNRAAGHSIWKSLETLDPQDTIVHIHSWTKALSPSIFNSVSRLPFRWVITFHDYFLFCPTGGYFNYLTSAPCTLKPGSLSCIAANCDARSYAHKAVRVARNGLLQRILRRAGAPLNVIHISGLAKDIASPFLPASTRNFLVVNPNDTLKSARVPVKDNDAFVFIGRLRQEKGCRLFARAAQSLGAQATFLGSGEEADAIRRDCPAAEIIPWGGKDAVEKVLSKARTLIFPSIWYETGGLVVLEALAKGIPVIATSATGAADFIEDGVNGWTFATGNEADLVAKMRQLEDRRLADRMGAAAFERYWKAPPTLERHLDRLDDVYGQILSERQGTPCPKSSL